MKVIIRIASLFWAVVFCFITVHTAHAADIAVRLLNETPDGLDMDVTISNYSLIASPYQSYQKIVIQGCGSNAREGAPGVSLRGQLIELPEGSELAVSYQSLDRITLRNVLLAPAPYAIVEEDKAGSKQLSEQYRIDEAAYTADALYPGKLAVADFTGYLRDKHIANIILYPVQYNPVARTLEIHTRYKVHLRFIGIEKDAGKNQLTAYKAASRSENTQQNTFSTLYKTMLLNYKAEGSTLSQRSALQPLSTVHAQSLQTENSPFAVRVTLKDEGIYRVSYDDLNALSIDLTATTNENIKMENQGREVPVYRSSSGPFKSGDYLLFYGEPFKSLYSKNNIYWIYRGSGAGKKIEQMPAGSFNSSNVQQTFNNSYHGEVDKKYWESIPNGANVDHWFWESLQPTEITTAKVVLSPPAHLGNISTAGGNYTMKVNFRGETTLAHHTRVYVNGTVVADFTWNGQIEYTKNIPDITPTVFKNGDNAIQIEEVLDPGTTVDRIYINWFDISYTAAYVAESDMLKCSGSSSGNASLEIKKFTTNNIWVLDITNPLTVTNFTNTQITQSGGQYTIAFGETGSGNKTYLAVAASKFITPVDMVVDEISNPLLQSPRTDIDYIIITHELFFDVVQDLKQYREDKGHRVEVVKIQDIYDEFSYGIKDARAIKDFLTYAYNNWNSTGHPTYVLLVGDASIDYRDDTGNFAKGNVDFVPTYLTQTDTLGDTPTDNWFVCVNGTDLFPDMLIGRMCVKTVEDAISIINKIKTYEEGSAGAWTKKIILAADQGADFTNVSDTLAKILPSNYAAEKVYLENYSDVTVATSDLVSKINAGGLATNYTGHGSVDNWAGEFLFHTPDDKDQVPRNDVDLLNNGQNLTFVITLDCLNGFFPNFLDKYSLAEELVRAENKGAIACFASTGLGFTSDHEVLAKNIFENLFNKGENIIGQLVTLSKIAAYTELQTRDIVETFVLLGDPATELKTSSVPSSIKLLNPGDAAVLHRTTRYTFTWDDTNNTDKYKIEFSADPDFPVNKIMRAPLIMSQFIAAREYTPNFFIWFILNIMGIQNEKLYWRVVSYGTGNEILEYSQTRSFSIKK